MCVNTDTLFSESQGKDKVGRLSADSGKIEKFFEVIGDLTIVLIDEFLADLEDVFSFALVESHRINQLPDFLWRELEHLFRRTRPAEKSTGCLGCDFVLCSEAQER